ncbi:MAG: B12-binding domain-containing radical SAM protein [Magnetococcus sp. DMHC-1]
MARVLLINPPCTPNELFSRGSKSTASIIPPLGLGYIAAYLMQHGHTCRIVDGMVEATSLEDLARLSQSFDVVGITVVSTFVKRVVELLQVMNRLSNHPPLIVGGPHVTVLPESLLRRGADYAVVGEGETTMLELVEWLGSGRNSRELANIRGVGYLENGEYVYTGIRVLIDPLDEVPMPARELLPMQAYSTSISRSSRQPSHSMMTSRGCPGNCTFCSKKTFGTGVRYFSTERIINEFVHLKNVYHSRDIAIWDDNFVANPDRVVNVCDGLKRLKFDLSWSVEARIDAVSLEILKDLKSAGCSYIAYGIESGSQRVLDYVHKRITLDQIRHTCAVTKESGLAIRGYFMLGFPTETLQEMEETIRFAIELDPEVASFTLLVPLPGTAEYFRAKKNPQFDPDWFWKAIIPEFNFPDQPIHVPESMTASQLLSIHRSAYNRFYFRPSVLAKRLLASLRSKDDFIAAIKGGMTLAGNSFSGLLSSGRK